MHYPTKQSKQLYNCRKTPLQTKQTNNIKNVQKSNGVKHAAGSKQQTNNNNKQTNEQQWERT
eukprot:EC787625.1.p1 GENE.EC787625.1~~EC787625.1.p1  ORF type:complete len:62 (-),score=7.77 EC787625.1:224-409(-)